MRNRYLEQLDKIVKVRVVGKNIERFIFLMVKKKIHVIRIIPISFKEVHLIMKFCEYEKLKDIKTVLYNISIMNYMGVLNIRGKIKKNIILLCSIFLGVLILIFLSRLIFSVEVIHQDRVVRDLLFSELKKEHIDRFHFKKSKVELERIEDKILKNNKDKLEWIEIKESGTKYIVRVEERKIFNQDKVDNVQNIVSKKDAVIVDIKAYSGEKVKSINDFVKKGDIIISSFVTLPDNTKVLTSALGEVLGEVWYTVKIDYPFVYQESRLTGKKKNVLAVYFPFYQFRIFNFRKFRTFSLKNKVLFSDMLLPISFILERQYETQVMDEVYTEDIAKNKAINYVKDKMMRDNLDIKDISEVKILTSSSDEDSIRLHLFVRAIENIGEVSNILEKENK